MVFECWNKEDGYYTASTFQAADHEAAAIAWARDNDTGVGEYGIASVGNGGRSLIVCVLEQQEKHGSHQKYLVTGELIPQYSARITNAN